MFFDGDLGFHQLGVPIFAEAILQKHNAFILPIN